MQFDLSFKKIGQQAILIEWPDRIDESILDDLLHFKQQLTSNLKNSLDIIDVVTAYNSLCIIHRNDVPNFARRIEILKKIYAQSPDAKLDEKRLIHIPVCYEASFAKDLKVFLETKNLTLSKLIELHVRPTYKVYFLGFLPGFMYLGGLVEALHLPRKGIPELHIPKGAVAIGGGQTGIYPQESPGGWHVIGSSPIEFFNIDADSPCVAQPGDNVRFYPISSVEYSKIQSEVKLGNFVPRSEPCDA